MVRRLSLLAAAVVFAVSISTVPAQAQGTAYIGGGVTFPTGDFGDEPAGANVGWMATGGYIFDAVEFLDIGLEGFYGQNTVDDIGTITIDATKLYGGFGTVMYPFEVGGSITPYVFGGAGWMFATISGEETGTGTESSNTESGFAWNVGGGVSFPLSPTMQLYGEGRYTAATGDLDGIKFFGVFAGLAFEM